MTGIGGLAEVVADGATGWVVPPGSPAPIADALTRIATEPEGWRGFGAAARARYASVFSEGSAAEGIGAVLRMTLRRSRSADPAATAELPSRSAT